MNRNHCRNINCRCPAHAPRYNKTCTRCQIQFVTQVPQHYLCRGCFRANPPPARPQPIPQPAPVLPIMRYCDWCNQQYDYSSNPRSHCLDCIHRISDFVNNNHSDGDHRIGYCLQAIYISPQIGNVDPASDQTYTSRSRVLTFQLPMWMSSDDFDADGNYTGNTYIFDQVDVVADNNDASDDQHYVFLRAFIQSRGVVAQAFST